VYEVGLRGEFRAWHLMPGVEGPEAELHHHDYRLEVVMSRLELDERGMVCDLDVLARAVTGTVAKLEGRNLEMIRPKDAEAVTVEVLSRWVHQELVDLIQEKGDQVLSVRVWESPVAFGGFSAPLTSSS
jgi:6-pyruvoyltetrahydropterin/6-carboxytetrahydropterin synthase